MKVSSSKSKVYFFIEQKSFVLTKQARLKLFIEDLFRKEKKRLKSLNYIFTSDKRLLEINREFLYHDYYTDIISFDLGDPNLVDGEIYISIDRVRENAENLSVSFKKELYRVIIHGALHLSGYGDKTSVQIKKMRTKEEHYLKLIDF